VEVDGVVLGERRRRADWIGSIREFWFVAAVATVLQCVLLACGAHVVCGCVFVVCCG